LDNPKYERNKLNFPDFRLEILRLIKAAKFRLPLAYVHLVYAPEVSDPLELAQDSKRDVALIRAPYGTREWPVASVPRLITLDCRRVAAYLLESDTSIDDPLLESSISTAHADIFQNKIDPVLLLNEEPGLVQSAVCGWIISNDSATRFAARIGSVASQNTNSTRRKSLRWYDPEFILSLWPSLSHEQRHALLGDADWIACNAANGVLHFRAEQAIQVEDPNSSSAHRRLSAKQLQTVENVAVVSALVMNWKSMCEDDGGTLAADATKKMHAHVVVGQSYGLDGDDLAIYAMIAVQLPQEATSAPEFTGILATMKAENLALRDALHQLPDIFWRRYPPIAQQGKL
jgi:hypothetical protein